LAEVADREIVVVGWGEDVVARDINYLPRFRGAAERAASRHGVPLRWCGVPRGAAATEAGLDEILGSHRPGLLLASSVTEAMNALYRRGLRPGVDLDVVALATHAEAEAFPTPLTAVSTRPRDVSRQATDWLFTLLDDPSAPGEIRLVPAELTRRGSVRPARDTRG
ncbi:MAG: substrate-binding domain-containing protein, partial [Janthinobacterium lividum]